ncbi:S41 family peptidase [Bacteroidota bacterium]
MGNPKKNNIKSILLAFTSFMLLHVSFAQELEMDKELRKETVNQVVQMLTDKYVLPDIGKKYADLIKVNLVNGKYNNITNPHEFAEKLTVDIKEVQDDQHFRIRFDPRFIQNMRNNLEISDEERERNRERQLIDERRRNYGFQEVKILAGNIGYLKLNEFASERASETAIAAIGFLTYSDAIIIDIRNNNGGCSEMTKIIGSYFFSDDYPQEFSSIYNRITDKIYTYKTQTYVPGKRLVNTDLYILVSEKTFSAAEAFAYDLKHLKRATIVGERTRGGAHATKTLIVNDYFVIDMPFARAINPITKSNWEGTGVEPDIKCEANDALQKALSIILSILIEENTDEYFLNKLGYSLIAEDNINLAIEVFKKNTEIHPESSNTYDSLGEAYMLNNNKEPAIKNYKKSLELNPNNINAKKMLKKLK